MIARAAAALVRSPRLRPAVLAGGAGLLLVLAAAPGETGPAVARAALVAVALAAAGALARRRAGADRAAAPALAVLSRAALSRDAGVAVVEVGSRRLLVGFGRGGVRVLGRAGEPGGAP